MARKTRRQTPNLDQPGQPPLLQGHLRSGGQRDPGLPGVNASTDQPGGTPAPDAAAPMSPQPATEGAHGDADAARGKATRSPAEVATRPHLEGPEQSPM
jgi:hypothetical protein